jgi:hypothetical protein
MFDDTGGTWTIGPPLLRVVASRLPQTGEGIGVPRALRVAGWWGHVNFITDGDRTGIPWATSLNLRTSGVMEWDITTSLLELPEPHHQYFQNLNYEHKQPLTFKRRFSNDHSAWEEYQHQLQYRMEPLLAIEKNVPSDGSLESAASRFVIITPVCNSHVWPILSNVIPRTKPKPVGFPLPPRT